VTGAAGWDVAWAVRPGGRWRPVVAATTKGMRARSKARTAGSGPAGGELPHGFDDESSPFYVPPEMRDDPLSTTDITTAALFRLIEPAGGRPPTLILDEADRLFWQPKKDEDNRELIPLLNNGFRPGRPTYRCVGPQ
jgi:hypothetical protein